MPNIQGYLAQGLHILEGGGGYAGFPVTPVVGAAQFAYTLEESPSEAPQQAQQQGNDVGILTSHLSILF